ncbi:hypothetical protein J7E63_15890 [Bacillus sp. ISL-75]|uniref:hypothetical protein n=1 Tax=Bacillus sp. ISL-75 TaxID=2819137 RepID=UPI001BE703D2|nr:hypothetical protein [Bacillus sp. ISL-75]MBT2728411.1 hypothetical protein [Bacillus sp. ISL-75]
MATIKKNKDLTATIVLDDDRIFEILENNDIKPSQAKINKIKKIFNEAYPDFMEQLEEALEEIVEEIANEEWGE